MATIKHVLGIALLSISPHLTGQGLDKAEVRIPYSELKQLLARAEPVSKPIIPKTPKPALLSARLRLLIEKDRPVIDATFRVTSFNNDFALVPLVAGDISLEKQEPADAPVVMDGNSLCITLDKAGTRTLQLRLLPVIGKDGFSLSLPPCPSAIFETGDFPADQSVVLSQDGQEETLAAGQVRPLPHSGKDLTIRLLDSRETHEALRPPEPSTWTWQHQALVIPTDGDLVYQLITRASAADGSGVEALLPLPPDAQDVEVAGDDLVSHSKIRGDGRSLGLSLTWKTRGILDRQLMISYRMPLRPLDRTWRLQAPGGDGARTRFIIASSPLLSYAADGLSGPLSPQGLPAPIAAALNGGTCHQLETSNTAELSVTSIPVAATAEGVVTRSEWALKIEPDGAMLATGMLAIEHKAQLGFVFDIPEGMKLLSCEVAGKPVTPVDLGGGVLKVTLSPKGEDSHLTCSFTGHTTALDPVEGTMTLSLPKIPLFIHSLLWHLDLPSGYQAETHGNLKRSPATDSGQPSRISLVKNLCRDERPEIHVFYQRSDLNR
jgi:hypothetical protein